MSEAVRRLQDYDTEKRYQATVVSSVRITSESSDEEVRELLLDVERPDFPYRVGQSIGVLAPATTGTLRPAASRIAVAIPKDAATMRGDRELGTMCRQRIRLDLTPMDLADKT